MDKCLTLYAQTNVPDAVLCLNGIFLKKLPLSTPVLVPVHECVANGKNHIQLGRLCSGEWLARQDIWFDVRLELVKLRQGQWVQPKVLDQFRWAEPAGKLVRGTSYFERELQLPLSFPRWQFLDLSRFESTAHTQPVQDLLVQLALELVQRKKKEFSARFSHRNHELAMAYGVSPVELAAQLDAVFEQHAGFALENYLPDLSELAVFAAKGGTTGFPMRADGSPFLHLPGLPDSVHVPLQVAVVEGRAVVVK
ncbi:MAG: hypothetical protein HC848_00045 [Limnobacter sp.]|nr:hypothetical protein [Limnobacter sp.]